MVPQSTSTSTSTQRKDLTFRGSRQYDSSPQDDQGNGNSGSSLRDSVKRGSRRSSESSKSGGSSSKSESDGDYERASSSFKKDLETAFPKPKKNKTLKRPKLKTPKFLKKLFGKKEIVYTNYPLFPPQLPTQEGSRDEVSDADSDIDKRSDHKEQESTQKIEVRSTGSYIKLQNIFSQAEPKHVPELKAANSMDKAASSEEASSDPAPSKKRHTFKLKPRKIPNPVRSKNKTPKILTRVSPPNVSRRNVDGDSTTSNSNRGNSTTSES